MNGCTRVAAGEMMRCPTCRQGLGKVAPGWSAIVCVGEVPSGGESHTIRCHGTLLKFAEGKAKHRACHAEVHVVLERVPDAALAS